MKKLLLFLLLLPGLVSAQYGNTLRVYSSISKIPRPTALGDTVVAIVSGQGMVFVTKNSQGQYYLGSNESTGCLISTTTAMIVNGVLTITPRGGVSGQYQSRLSTETNWSSSMTRTGQFGQIVVYVRDAVNISCETALTVDGSIDSGINAPSFVAATPASGTGLSVTWSDNSTNENGFQLQFSKSSTFSTVDQTATAPANTTSYTTQSDFFPGGQLYFVRVRATMQGSNTTLYSAWSNVAQATTNTVLSPPTTFALQTKTTNTASLVWTTSQGATGYTIEYGLSATNFTNTLNVGATNTATITNLQPSTTYFARLRATSQTISPSAWTPTIEFRTNATAIVLGKPANLNLTASQTADRTFTATWTNVSPVGQTYRVQISPNNTFASGVEEMVVNNSGSSLTYTSTNTTTTVYYVRVRAESSSGISEWSDIKSVTTRETLPTQPTNLLVTNTNNTGLSLSWEYGVTTSINGFEVQFATNATFTSGIQNATVPLGPSPYTYTTTTLNSNTAYFARVRATQASGNPGDWSNVVYATTGANASQLTQTAITSSSVSLSWQTIPGSTGYVLEQLSAGNVWVSKATGLSGTSYTVQNLTPSTSYTFRIKGVQGTATSRPSTSLQVTTPAAANVIYPFTNVVVTSIPGGYQLTATDPNSFAHNIRIDTSSNGEFNGPPISGIIDSERKTSGGDLIRTYTGFPAGKVLSFRVLAWEPGYEYANGGTGWSATVQGTAGNNAGGGPTTPSNVAGQPLSATSARITWQDQSNNEEGFTVQLNTSSGFASGNLEKTTGPVASTGANGSVDFTGLAPNTTYYVRVRSYVTGATSAWTTPVSFITATASVPTPTITGTATSDNKSATISWNTNGATNVTSYTVERKIGNGEFMTLLDGIIPNTTTLNNITQDQPNQSYSYRVKTITSNGESAFSNPVTFNPPVNSNTLNVTMTDNQPTSKTLVISNLSSSTVNWSIYVGDADNGGSFTGCFDRGVAAPNGTFTISTTTCTYCSNCKLTAGVTYRFYVSQGSGDPRQSYVEFTQPGSTSTNTINGSATSTSN